jgi:PadR family transcriptional regulator, regulatory protein PadR
MDRSQLLRGTLDASALAVVAEEDGYGYDIVRRLRAAGLTDVGDASVYGTLRRLEQAGHLESRLVASDSGPARKYYSVTSSGTEQLRAGTDTWRGISKALESLVKR